MRKSNLIITILLALAVWPTYGQRHKPVTKKKAVPTVEIPKEVQRFEEMLEATQQIVFIDSVVVSKKQFLDIYRLGSEAGIITTFNQFFRTDSQPYATVCVNQLGNKCWFSNNGRLFTSDLLGSEWSEPAELEGLGHFQRTNYPFILSDGTTLYFAAIGEKGLGGLDIYVSRYDSESGKYLLSENIGLPFNSDANDYMYAVDELNNIGFFASDRRQPEGYVCIYTFIPNQKRLTYASTELDSDAVRSRARIDRISDTWGDNEARRAALDRLRALTDEKPTAKKKSDFTFVINDNLTYTSLSDFRDPDNRDRITEMFQMRNQYDALGRDLEKTRLYYASKATPAEQNTLRKVILEGEQHYYQQGRLILHLEKNIRNAEIKLLKH